jgi:uncharacterized protein YgbK (DUF1537 family)
MSKLLVSFFGDDFTGSTDALESLALAGLKTVLFTAVPTEAQLAKHPDLQAFGIAGRTRSMRPDEIEQTLRPVFTFLRNSGSRIIHYKVCSTFDSSPEIGSIGRVIDVGMEVFGSRPVPVLVGAPALGRYCVFGNLYARFGANGPVSRLDRHPSMSQHPITPMREADLRVHLAKQTGKTIGLLDVTQVVNATSLDSVDGDVVLIDILEDSHLEKAGQLLDDRAKRKPPLFTVGSSGVESALAAHWKYPPRKFEHPRSVGPIVVVCGSCSPVTAGQIQWASANGFDSFTIGEETIRSATRSIQNGKSVAIHTNSTDRVAESSARDFGKILGQTLREILSIAPVRRVIVAGGDTSGDVASALGIESMEMIGELTRGSPLVRVCAPGSPADGIEMTFKGGQIGPVDFFGKVRADA